MREFEDIGEDLLEWYDANARLIPWRIPPADSINGQRQDPYRVWLSEIMLQQTTVAAVEKYFHYFTKRWPNVNALASAKDEDVMAAWAGLGYYARARNLLKCARYLTGELNGIFPNTEAELLKLPGVGPYTAAAIASIAFGERAVVVDGNVDRVVSRLFNIDQPLPKSKPTIYEKADALTPHKRPGDYAQAMMDLGATVCGRAPKCMICPLAKHCLSKRAGTAGALPKRMPKKPKPTRHGISYIVIREDGAILLEDRPARGLLGGMRGIPGSDWVEDTPIDTPPVSTTWDVIAGNVTHVFTHFRLDITVKTAKVPRGANPDRGIFVAIDSLNPATLPTVFLKILEHGTQGNDLYAAAKKEKTKSDASEVQNVRIQKT